MGGYRWSKEEIKVIDEMYGNSSIGSIKAKLKAVSGKSRTYDSIRKKAQKLGFGSARSRNEFITAKVLAECMGYSKYTVFKSWEKWGLKIHLIVITNRKKISKINVDEFWEFAYENRDRIDFSEYQRGSLIPEPSWLKEELQREQKRARASLDKHKETQIISLRKLGFKNKEIAQKVGITDARLHTALRSIHKRGKVENRAMRVPFSKEELKLIKKLADDGKTYVHIGEEVGRSAETVRKKIALLKKKGEWEKIEA